VRNSPAELGIREELAVGRSAASFEEFFRAEQLRLHRVLFAITGSQPEVEDIGQEAFLRLWERWDRVNQMDDPAGYLHRTAIRFPRSFPKIRARLETCCARFAAAGRIRRVRGTFGRGVGARLASPRQRAAIVLTEALGYSADEAGKLLGIKGSTVRALHFQARSALRGSKEAIDG